MSAEKKSLFIDWFDQFSVLHNMFAATDSTFINKLALRNHNHIVGLLVVIDSKVIQYTKPKNPKGL